MCMRSHKRGSDPLEMEIQMFASCCAGAGSQAQLFYKSRAASVLTAELSLQPCASFRIPLATEQQE